MGSTGSGRLLAEGAEDAEYYEEQARARRDGGKAKKIGAEKAALYADAEKARKTKVLTRTKKIAEFAKQTLAQGQVRTARVYGQREQFLTC